MFLYSRNIDPGIHVAAAPVVPCGSECGNCTLWMCTLFPKEFEVMQFFTSDWDSRGSESSGRVKTSATFPAWTQVSYRAHEVCPALPGAVGLWSLHWTDGLYMHNKCHVFPCTDHLWNVGIGCRMLPENLATLWLMLCNVTETIIFKGLRTSSCCWFQCIFQSRRWARLGLHDGVFGRTDAACESPEYSKKMWRSSSLWGFLKNMVQDGRLHSAAGVREIFQSDFNVMEVLCDSFNGTL